MKRIAAYIIMMILSLAGGTALYGQRIEIFGAEQANDGQTLELSARIEAGNLRTPIAGGYKLVMSVGNRDRKILLPEVRYVSRLRGLSEKRREKLFGAGPVAPYEIHTKIKAKKTYTTEYTVSMPYYGWMRDARFEYTLYSYECDGLREVARGTVCTIEQPVLRYAKPETQIAQPVAEVVSPVVAPAAKRSESISVALTYPYGEHTVRPAYGANTAELARIDDLMKAHLGNGRVKPDAVYITGYGAPDGAFADNEPLVGNRTKALENYMKARYDLTGVEVYSSWVTEDWDGLIRAVNADPAVPERQKVLNAIEAGLGRDPDTREWLIKTIGNRVPYNYLLENIYPSLRRMEIEVNYGTAGLNADQSPTNRNMAVTQTKGDAWAAFHFLREVCGDPCAWANTGAYTLGDPAHAWDFLPPGNGTHGREWAVNNMELNT